MAKAKRKQTNDLDFLQAYRDETVDTKSLQTDIWKFILPPLVLLLMVGGLFGFFKYKEVALQKDIDKLKEEIAYVDQKLAASSEKQLKFSELTAKRASLSSLKEIENAIVSYPHLDGVTLNTVVRLTTGTTLKSISYDQNTGIFSFVAETEDVSIPEGIARSIRSSNAFDNILYFGYTGKEESANTTVDPITGQVTTSSAKTVYTVNMTCLVKGGS